MEHAHSAKQPNYLLIAIYLGVLTVAEVIIASQFPTAAWKVPVLILLSFGKGGLVALYYMHLRYDSRLYSFFFAFALFLLAIPFVLSLIVLFSNVPGAGHGVTGGG